MRKLAQSDRVQIVRCLVEGNSIRSTCRMTGAAKGTVLKLLRDLGTACKEHHDLAVRGLKTTRVECDEVWSFVAKKDKQIAPKYRNTPEVFGGSAWTWTALDSDSKLAIGYHVGSRDADCGMEFMQDVADRLTNRVQLTTDGHHVYLNAVDAAFGTRIDYAMLVKQYGKSEEADHRYSPCECVGIRKVEISGRPDRAKVSTSYVERANLTIRMGSRRFTRLTNAFSKKLEFLRYSVALHFCYYNFARKHSTLKTSPAVAAGIADHVWTVEEIVGLLDAKEAADIAAGSLKRGKYAPRANSK